MHIGHIESEGTQGHMTHEDSDGDGFPDETTTIAVEKSLNAISHDRIHTPYFANSSMTHTHTHTHNELILEIEMYDFYLDEDPERDSMLLLLPHEYVEEHIEIGFFD